jgi:hypothetical protein
MVKPWRRGLFNPVGLNVGEPVAVGDVTVDLLRERVAGLMRVG